MVGTRSFLEWAEKKGQVRACQRDLEVLEGREGVPSRGRTEVRLVQLG